MKALALARLYWPGMAKEVEGAVRSCDHCARSAAYPVKVPLAPWPDPGKPWVRVHVDLAEPQKGSAFLVVVDAFSNYVVASFITPATSSSVIEYLRVLFRHFGPPETLVSDNGGQFSSTECAAFCQGFDVIHLRSAPYAPQSNGEAEKMVGTSKRSLEEPSQDALDEAVATYNYTPSAVLAGKAPGDCCVSSKTKRAHAAI